MNKNKMMMCIDVSRLFLAIYVMYSIRFTETNMNYITIMVALLIVITILAKSVDRYN